MTESGFQHQCRTPPVWWARLIGSRTGREWICGKCGQRWVLGFGHVPYLRGSVFIEWRETLGRMDTGKEKNE